MASAQTLPTDSQARKNIPLARGCLDYFPAALAAVAELSLAGNKKHNPGEELHHARGKSSDHADTILRHLLDRGTVDPDDGILHSTKVAWRALALLQEELEAGGSPLARGARLPEAPKRGQRVLHLENLTWGHLSLPRMQEYVDNYCKHYVYEPDVIRVTKAQAEWYRTTCGALTARWGSAAGAPGTHFEGIPLEVV